MIHRDNRLKFTVRVGVNKHTMQTRSH